ncbi:YbfB/YjiJ family MFS transporter [Desulforhabdus amnigena]|uniref:MFS transporter n=1 Tax=Desulforhabdus amnigena TaxID=40218 RepID=A0A9W6L9R8_9BACT|nr:YbfB/YjiJ family MFS transporter [Desulforhabdus amnigena]NLJ28133.1 YbfB/YjiJ family MFS transporter [Deltaproteobacteria bacterium]GLI35475.1 MFS transporter [Desulforhabdus amnigena]
MISLSKIRNVHYGWIIVATGALVLFSCLGLARFAYTMLLPGMQAGLGLSYDRMGFIGTANFIGYLVAVILAPTLLSRFRPHPTIAAALLLIALGMFGISQSQNFAMVSLLYTLVGIGTGFANIPMMVLLTYWFHSDQRGKAAGLVIGGNGMGIIFAGFLIPLLNHGYGPDGWRMGWSVIGLISLMTAACAALLLRSHPSDLGLEPVGRPLSMTPDQLKPHHRPSVGSILLRLGLLYLVFGATFMIYGTFIVTTMVKEYGFSEQQAGLYWSWVGFFSLFSGVGFGALSDMIGRKRGLALVFAVQTAAYLLAGLKLGSMALMVSIVLYGLAVFAIPTIMAAAVGDYVGLSRAAGAFTTITLFFALGQAVGPGSAGLIAGATGSFTAAYQVASLLTASAAVLAVTLPSPGDAPAGNAS